MDAEILLFDGVEELDVFGPLSVLAPAGFGVTLVAEGGGREITGAHGSGLIARREAGLSPGLLIIPGGGWVARARQGAWAEARRGALPALIADRYAAGSTLAAVCTGTMLVAAAGLLNGRPAVTHHDALDDLAATGARVMPDARVVDDGRIVTAGAVTAGIDLALWLVQRHLGAAAAAAQAAHLAYQRSGTVWRARPPSSAASQLVTSDEVNFAQAREQKITA